VAVRAERAVVIAGAVEQIGVDEDEPGAAAVRLEAHRVAALGAARQVDRGFLEGAGSIVVGSYVSVFMSRASPRRTASARRDGESGLEVGSRRLAR
jgi:hypothetical protein